MFPNKTPRCRRLVPFSSFGQIQKYMSSVASIAAHGFCWQNCTPMLRPKDVTNHFWKGLKIPTWCVFSPKSLAFFIVLVEIDWKSFTNVSLVGINTFCGTKNECLKPLWKSFASDCKWIFQRLQKWQFASVSVMHMSGGWRQKKQSKTNTRKKMDAGLDKCTTAFKYESSELTAKKMPDAWQQTSGVGVYEFAIGAKRCKKMLTWLQLQTFRRVCWIFVPLRPPHNPSMILTSFAEGTSRLPAGFPKIWRCIE